MLDKLRKKAIKLKEDTQDSKYDLIIELLKDDKVFFKIDVNTAISILMDLGFDNNEAMKLYVNLTSRDNFGG